MARYSDNRKRILTVERIIVEHKDGISINGIIAILEIEYGIKASVPSIQIDIETLRDFLPIDAFKKPKERSYYYRLSGSGTEIFGGDTKEKKCALCGEKYIPKSNTKYCPKCREYLRAPQPKRKKLKPMPKPKYSIRDIAAIETALKEKTNQTFSYSQITEMMKQGKVYIDNIKTVDGVRTAEISISGLTI